MASKGDLTPLMTSLVLVFPLRSRALLTSARRNGRVYVEIFIGYYDAPTDKIESKT